MLRSNRGISRREEEHMNAESVEEYVHRTLQLLCQSNPSGILMRSVSYTLLLDCWSAFSFLMIWYEKSDIVCMYTLTYLLNIQNPHPIHISME